jgi:hypothetical protein
MSGGRCRGCFVLAVVGLFDKGEKREGTAGNPSGTSDDDAWKHLLGFGQLSLSHSVH